MVVQGIIALALALPTGMLFGVGYGTGVRIGYEQIYPLLFPKGTGENNATQVKDNMKAINTIYDTIGGKEASNMGIAQGLNSARSELENNPDFRYFTALELNQSGLTPSNSVNPNSSSTPTSSPPPASFNVDDFNAGSPDVQAQAALIREITDIPSLMRMSDREAQKAIPSIYILQTITARINLLRGSNIEETIQEKQQRELGERVPAPISSNRQTTNVVEVGSYERAQYQNKTFTLSQKIVTDRNNAAIAKRSLEAYNQRAVKHAPAQNARVKTLNSMNSRLDNSIKAMITHISLSRNNNNLKSLANADWNNRIWK